MKLYLKHHGMPGLGVTGENGQAGNHGKSILFGFINDFFDCTNIPISTIVKEGKRKPTTLPTSVWNRYIADRNATLTDEIGKLSNSGNNVTFNNPVVNGQYKITPDNRDYVNYTGRVTDNNATNTILTTKEDGYVDYSFDIADNELFSNMVYNGTSSSITNPTVDSYEFHLIYNLSYNNKSYVEMYEYNKDLESDLYTNEPKFEIKIAVNSVTYEPEDVAKMLGKYKAYSMPDTGNIDTTLFTYLKYTNTGLLESNTPLDNNNKFYFEKSVFDSNYPMGVDSYKATFSNGLVITSLRYPGKYLPPLTTGNATITNIWKYIHITTSTYPTSDMDEAYTDEYGMTQIGIDMYNSSIYEAVTLSGDEIKVDDLAISQYLEQSLLNTELDNFVNDFSDVIYEFANTYQVKLNHYKNNGTSYPDSSVRWDSSNYKNIQVPVTLKDDIQTGDILYFYTDESRFVKDRKVEYMVTITDELKNCDVNTLIQHANITEPFSYLTLFTNDSNTRIKLCNNTDVIISEQPILTQNGLYYMRSLGNMLSKNNESKLLLAVKENMSEDSDNNTKNKENFLFLHGHDFNIRAVQDSQLTIQSGDIESFGIDDNAITGNIFKISTSPNNNSIVTPIKFETLYGKTDCAFSNIELYNILHDPYIIFDNTEYIASVDDGDIIEKINIGAMDNQMYNFCTYKFVQNKSSYISDPALYNNYLMGVDITANLIIDDNRTDCAEYYQYNTSNDELDVEMDPVTDSGVYDSTHILHQLVQEATDVLVEYNIISYVRHAAGFKHYSRSYNLVCHVKSNGVIFGNTEKYTGYIEGENDIINETTVGQNEIKIDFSGLTCNKLEESLCVIYSDEPNIVIDEVIFNNTAINMLSGLFIPDYTIDMDYAEIEADVEDRVKNNLTFHNSWFTAFPVWDTLYEICCVKTNTRTGRAYKVYPCNNDGTLTYTSGEDMEGDTIVTIENRSSISFMVSVDDNIPNIAEYGSAVMTSTASDYMVTLNDNDGEEGLSIDVYKDIFGVNYTEACTILCDLFSKLSDNFALPSTASRTMNIFVKYHYIDRPNDYLYETFSITLPGFTDPRTIPLVNLNMHNKLFEIEQYNSIDNGVLCNQFQTYMDIDISNFGYDNWGKYITKESDATLDIEITNLATDLKWVDNLSITNAFDRSTVKMLVDKEIILNAPNNKQYANYIAFLIDLVKDVDATTLSKLSDKDIITLSLNESFIDISSSLYIMSGPKGISPEDTDIINGTDGKTYILLTDNVMSGFVNPANIYSGIFNSICIKLRNLTISDIESGLHLRIKVEFGNPVLSNIYFLFAVTKMVINYTKDDGETYTFTTTANKSIDTCLHLITDYKETYAYISEPLDVMINPISYTACPPEVETKLIPLSGAVKKEGSEDNIMIKTSFYLADLYADDITSLSKQDLRATLLMSWEGVQLKKKYLLDNIQNISIASMSLDEIMPLVADESLTDKQHLFWQTYNNIMNVKQKSKLLPEKCYFSVTYDSAILNPKLRDELYTFYYNEKLYLKSKYDQVDCNCPVFTNQTHDWQIRSNDIMDGIDVWNFEYQSYDKKALNDISFTGIINTFGNGYMYLPEDIDTGQYENNDVLPLADILSDGNIDIHTLANYSYINNAGITNVYTPALNKYFRVPLYNVNWEYPYYTGDNEILSHKIVSAFDYLIYTYNKNGDNDTVKNSPYFTNACIRLDKTLSENYNEKFEDVVPYNLLFSLSPRAAYNTDNETLNVFMLRMPTVVDDDDVIKEPDGSIKMPNSELRNENRLFKLSNSNLEDMPQTTIPYACNNQGTT